MNLLLCVSPFRNCAEIGIVINLTRPFNFIYVAHKLNGMAVNPTDVPDVPQDLQDEKGKMLIALAGGFASCLGVMEVLMFAGVAHPSAEIGAGVHTLFISMVSMAGAFFFKRQK